MPNPASSSESSPGLYVVGTCSTPIWGSTPERRVRKQFQLAGVTRNLSEHEAARYPGSVIVVRADVVLDAPLIPLLRDRSDFFLLSEGSGEALAANLSGERVSEVAGFLTKREKRAIRGLVSAMPSQLGADFWKALRKRETPYAMIVSSADAGAIEWRMFMGTYKGATDIITKRLWPFPAFYATRLLAGVGVSPNVVTLAGTLLVFVAFWLFLRGHYGPGLVAAWVMTFLDTVDGKLARTTLATSKWGDILDHGIDLVHPPFWYIAWAIGLKYWGFVWNDALFWSVIVAILGGYILQRLIEGAAIKWLGLEIHIWRRIDTLFREVTARRNPNLVLLTLATLFGRPDIGLLAVAVWTIICLILHAVQLLQAFTAKRNGPLSSWMARPVAQ